MTIEGHIENLKAMASDMPSDKCSDWIESLMAGVKALEQESCDDAISRQAVLEVIRKCHCEEWVKADIGAPIEVLPPVTPKPKMGRWIPIEYDGYADGSPVWDKWECSECGYEHNGDEESLTAFCPDCGRKMEVGENG